MTAIAVVLAGSPTSAETAAPGSDPKTQAWSEVTALLQSYGVRWDQLDPWTRWVVWTMALSGALPAPAPAPTPTPTGTPSPSPTSPSPSPSPSPSAPATPTPSPTPSPTSAPTAKPAPPPSTPTPTPSKPAPAPATPSVPTLGPTGVPAGTALTVYEGELVVTTPGAVIDSLDVHGYIRVQAPDVTIKNTVVRGLPGLASGTGLVTNLDGYPGLVIQDSELAAANPTPDINGFMGSHTTFQRVNIHGVVDSVHITGDDVVIDSSWLHDNLHYDQDPNWNGGPSHDDNVQVQAGTNIVVRNSVLSGSKNAAIMVTQDRGAVKGLVVTGNKLNNGACTINLAEKSYGPIAATVTNNAFGTGQVYKYCAIKATLATQAVLTATRNAFSDGRVFSITP